MLPCTGVKDHPVMPAIPRAAALKTIRGRGLKLLWVERERDPLDFEPWWAFSVCSQLRTFFKSVSVKPPQRYTNWDPEGPRSITRMVGLHFIGLGGGKTQLSFTKNTQAAMWRLFGRSQAACSEFLPTVSWTGCSLGRDQGFATGPSPVAERPLFQSSAPSPQRPSLEDSLEAMY